VHISLTLSPHFSTVIHPIFSAAFCPNPTGPAGAVIISRYKLAVLQFPRRLYEAFVGPDAAMCGEKREEKKRTSWAAPSDSLWQILSPYPHGAQPRSALRFHPPDVTKVEESPQSTC
jgi:hypothetical protein